MGDSCNVIFIWTVDCVMLFYRTFGHDFYTHCSVTEASNRSWHIKNCHRDGCISEYADGIYLSIAVKFIMNADLKIFVNIDFPLQKGYEAKSLRNKRQIRYPVVFSRPVDGALQNLLDLAFRDFVGSWLSELAFSSDFIIDNMKQDVWGAIQSLHERLSRVDHTKLVACSIVNKVTFHFEKIRIAQAAV